VKQSGTSKDNGGKDTPIIRVDPRALNHFKHGIYSKPELLPGENRRHFKELEKSYYAYFQPIPGPESDIVDDIIKLRWKIIRVEKTLSLLQKNSMSKCPFPPELQEMGSALAEQEEQIHVLKTVINMLKEKIKAGEKEAVEYKKGMYVLIGKILKAEENFDSMTPGDLLERLLSEMEARNAELERTRSVCREIQNATKSQADLIMAKASFPDETSSERFQKEETSLERALERKVRLLFEMREKDHAYRKILSENSQISGSNGSSKQNYSDFIKPYVTKTEENNEISV
jgi:soluble cytochrome b562